MLAKASDLFLRLVMLAGSREGARTVSQTMVTDLIDVSYPTANEVTAPGGGDWGIDTYVGELGRMPERRIQLRIVQTIEYRSSCPSIRSSFFPTGST
jgi:hypothetical protein